MATQSVGTSVFFLLVSVSVIEFGESVGRYQREHGNLKGNSLTLSDDSVTVIVTLHLYDKTHFEAFFFPERSHGVLVSIFCSL